MRRNETKQVSDLYDEIDDVIAQIRATLDELRADGETAKEREDDGEH